MSFVHFNEDGSYYSSYFDKAVVDAGVWEVLDEELEYSVDAGPDGDANTVEDNTKAAAAQVVALTSYQTGETVKIAYVDDQLCDMSMAGLANHRNLAHDAGYAYNPATDETSIQLYVFYAGNSIGSNITLSHDRSFVDVTGDTFMDVTCKLVVEVAQTGQEMQLDQGTYTITETFKFQFVFDNAGELESVPDYENAGEQGLDMTLAYKADILIEEGGQSQQFNIDSELAGTYVPQM